MDSNKHGASSEELAFIARVLDHRARAIALRRRITVAGAVVVVTLGVLFAARAVSRAPDRAPVATAPLSTPAVGWSAVESPAREQMERSRSRPAVAVQMRPSQATSRDPVATRERHTRRAVPEARAAKNVARPQRPAVYRGQMSLRVAKAGHSPEPIRLRSVAEAP